MLKGFKIGIPVVLIIFFGLGTCFVKAATLSDSTDKEKAAAEMTMEFTPDRGKVGGIVNLVLRFHLPRGARLSSESPVQNLEGFQILDQKIIFSQPIEQKSVSHPGTSLSGECRIRLMVDRLDSGEIGPVSLSYMDAKGEEQLLKSSPVPFTVLSNLGDKPEEARLKPIYGIIPTGSVWIKYRAWILGAGGLLLLGAICGWWLRKRRKKGRDTILQTPPDTLAIAALKALDGQKLFEKGRVKDFYFGFSEILRRYVEAIRGFPAAEYTIEEIARTIKEKEDQAVLPLLRQVDMVKFADYTATVGRKDEDLETAFAYIRNTRDTLMKETTGEHREGGTS